MMKIVNHAANPTLQVRLRIRDVWRSHTWVADRPIAQLWVKPGLPVKRQVGSRANGPISMNTKCLV